VNRDILLIECPGDSLDTLLSQLERMGGRLLSRASAKPMDTLAIVRNGAVVQGPGRRGGL
jgi:hypothetical protein